MKADFFKFNGSVLDEDFDFDCGYRPISSLFDGAFVYYEEPYLDSTWFKDHTLYPYHLRKASIYEGRYAG